MIRERMPHRAEWADVAVLVLVTTGLSRSSTGCAPPTGCSRSGRRARPSSRGSGCCGR